MLIALLAVGALHYALPSALSPGPDWLVLLLVIALATPAIISHRMGVHRLAQAFSYAALGAVTAATVASLGWLVA